MTTAESTIPTSWDRFVNTHHAAGELSARNAGLALPDLLAVLELVWLRTADAIGDRAASLPPWFHELVGAESERRSQKEGSTPLTTSVLDTLQIARSAWTRSVHASGALLASVVSDSAALLAGRDLAVPLRAPTGNARDLRFERGSVEIDIRVFPSAVTGVVSGESSNRLEVLGWSGNTELTIDGDGRFHIDRVVDRAIALRVDLPDGLHQTDWFLG